MMAPEKQQLNVRLFPTSVKSKPKPKVELLRYADVPRTVERMMYARNESALHHYMFDTPDADQNPTLPYRDRIQIFLRWTDGVRRHELLTINRGDSVLLYSPASESVCNWRKAINKVMRSLIHRLLSVFYLFYTREQRRRMAELDEVSSAAITTALGDRLPELISLDNLVTAAEKQGLGYATSLVNFVLDLAAAQSRGVWLLTDDHTVGFYERFGFTKVGQYSVGEHNPTWTEDPITSCILIWEPDTDLSKARQLQ